MGVMGDRVAALEDRVATLERLVKLLTEQKTPAKTPAVPAKK